MKNAIIRVIIFLWMAQQVIFTDVKSKTVPAEISGDFERFMKWADEIRTLKVRTNADTPKDAAQAVASG